MYVQKDGLWQYSFGGLPFSRDILTSVRLLNARVSAAVLQNLSPSFSVTALAEVIGNFTSHLDNGIQDLLPAFTPCSIPVCPARSWHPGANCHWYHFTFLGWARKTSLEFWLRGGGILSCSHPSLLFHHPSTHSACRSQLKNNLTETSRFCMQSRAQLGLLTSNKQVITLFAISLWHPLNLESPWLRLCLVQQAQSMRWGTQSKMSSMF